MQSNDTTTSEARTGGPSAGTDGAGGDADADHLVASDQHAGVLAALVAPVNGWRERLAQATGGVLGLAPSGRGLRERWALVALLLAGVVAVFVVVRGGQVDRAEISLPMATRRGTTPGSLVASAGTVPVPLPAAEAPASGQPAPLWVAITGAVNRPGLYLLSPGARLSQVVAAAGGVTPVADPDRINLAAPLHDGERVYIPRRGDAAAPEVIAGVTASTASTSGVQPRGGAGPPATSAGPLNLNTATVEQLDTLPGIGPTTARSIIEHRTTNGAFIAVDELGKVRGIGPAKLAQLRPLVTV